MYGNDFPALETAFNILFSMFNDFIGIWLKNYDTQYILPYRDVIAIAFNFFVGCVLTPIWMYRETSGLFSQVKYSMTVAAILNIPTNIKSPIILATHAIATVVSGVFESPSPLNTPPITLYATMKTDPRADILR